MKISDGGLFLKKLFLRILILPIFAAALATGLIGLDFGNHWDEFHIIEATTQAVKSGLFMKRWYEYPDIPFYLSLFSLAPEIIRVYVSERPSDESLYNLSNVDPDSRASKVHTLFSLQSLSPISESHAFMLRVRAVFLFVSLLSIIWLYCLVLSWRKNHFEALLAAALVGGSWEINYHARWIASDAVMMQFGALTLLLLVYARNHREDPLKAKRWLKLSAIAAGLACGTKYQGGLMILPVLLATSAIFWLGHRKSLITALCQVFFAFALTYLISTPGTLLEPLHFEGYFRGNIVHYKLSEHGNHTVVPGKEHLLLSLGYLCFAVFSKYPIVACFFFVMAVIGVYSILKEEIITGLVFMSFPLVYIAYVSQLGVMIVRNLLILVPFLAILSARGCIFLSHRIFGKLSSVRFGFSTLIFLLLIINGRWLYVAASSIQNRKSANYIAQLARYIDERQNVTFSLDGDLVNDLAAFDHKTRPNIPSGPSEKTSRVVLPSDRVDTTYCANRYNCYTTWFGPYEVNFNYYPAWVGEKRIVVMPARVQAGRKLY